MNNAPLQLHAISRHFSQGGVRLDVLRGVNLSLNPGEMVALVGPSGSGKTTMLQIAGLLDRADGGTVLIGGEDVTRASDNKRTAIRLKRLGFIYQFHHLLPEFSAEENIALPQMIAGVSKNKARKRARELLAELGLEARAHHRPAALSGGEQQRVAIARAMANRPQILLADEPTGNLDPVTAESVFLHLIGLVKQKRVAALIATHNLELAARMDRAVRMQDGGLHEVNLKA